MLWACYKNRLDVVELLIERGAHINVVGEEDGLTPLLISSGEFLRFHYKFHIIIIQYYPI